MEAMALALPATFPLRRRLPMIPRPQWTRTPMSSPAFRSRPPRCSGFRFSRPSFFSISPPCSSPSSSKISTESSLGPSPDLKPNEEEFVIGKGDVELLPKEFYDNEWQAQQRKKTAEWHAYRRAEEEKENQMVDEYREIGMRLKNYPEEEVRKARQLVSSFIRSVDEVEQKIEEAAEKGELTELVLMVIWNRLDLARKDDEKDAVRCLDLLYRRVETEILKRESTSSMRLLNNLLNLHDGLDDDAWLKKCRKLMVETFPREDPFTMLVPTGFDVDSHQGRIGLPPTDDDVLLRADFVREVDALLQEVRAELINVQLPRQFDAESVATRLKHQEKQRAIHQVEALLELAVTLEW